MKIAILNTFAPFTFGGAEYLAESLCQKLKTYGYNANVIKIAFKWYPAQKVLESMLSATLLKLHNTDKVIALKFPAYLVSHPNKVVWLTHQFRQAYDLWGTDYQDIPNTIAGQQTREMIFNADNAAFNETKKIFAISDVVADRLKKFNRTDAEVLYPPLLHPEKFYCGKFEDYLFYPSRIGRGKRQHLAIEAMQYTKTAVKLIIAGSANHPEDLHFLQQIITKYNLSNKVTLLAERISEQQKIDLMAKCLACVFIPYDEDYGYVTLEAFSAKKPVITCQDSGGVLNFVRHNETGIVSSTEAKELAHSFDQLYSNKKHAKFLGEGGYEELKEKNMNWEHVLRKLLK